MGVCAVLVCISFKLEQFNFGRPSAIAITNAIQQPSPNFSNEEHHAYATKY